MTVVILWAQNALPYRIHTYLPSSEYIVILKTAPQRLWVKP